MVDTTVFMSDAASRKEIEERINTLLAAEREFAENSPMPPPELAEKGVYCTGDDCHKIRPKWQRPVDELLPPKSSVEPVWIVEGFGRGEASAGGSAPIHFGDVPAKPAETAAVSGPIVTPAPNSSKYPVAKKRAAKKPAKKESR